MLTRKVQITDITELSQRKDARLVVVEMNKAPQLQEVDNRINLLIESLDLYENTINSLETEYFKDVVIQSPEEEEIDEFNTIQSEFSYELSQKDLEYSKLIDELQVGV